MSITDQLLAALLRYGLPILFSIILVSAVGVPVPVTLMLVAAGSFVQQGEMKMWQVLAVAASGAVVGDQIGYGLARWGGRPLLGRISRRLGAEAKMMLAEAFFKQWSGVGVFFSRWLVTTLGPWVNVTRGIAAYPWHRFFLWDALGEILWVAIYVALGYVFSDRVQALIEVLGNLTWTIVGLVVTAILGWKLLQYRHTGVAKQREA